MDMTLGYLRLEATRLVRNISFLMVSLVTPLVMYVVLANKARGAQDTESLSFLTVTMAAFGAMGAVLNSGSGIAEDRAGGWLRQLRLMPVRPAQVVGVRALTGMLGAVPPVLAVQLAGALGYGVHHSPAQWAATVLVLWLGVAPLALLALGVGHLLRPQLAQAVSVAGYVLLSVVGGLWAPVDKLPHWLQGVSRVTPVNRYAELALDAAHGRAPHAAALLVLAGWLLASAGFALVACRRGSRAA
ncbi:ABC transporter permease [Streptomyces orinoci]|uniref:ABC transporter permease n=1 Tax=Streptomyces orinoci TaxID=67339 RepID=A0ABV3JT56_STRON|nr:ABC transporter permease [Streptomyces orinoci]